MTLLFRATLFLAVLACGDSPSGSDTTGTIKPPPADGVAFTYTPPAGAPAVASIYVAGSFNAWSTSETRMTRQPDGSWSVRVPLSNGQYQYKFFINGAWPRDMCYDPTWGDPAAEHWIDADALGCLPDGQGGQNAVMTVGAGTTPSLAFDHDPAGPAYVSAAGGRLSIRFRAYQGVAQEATIRVGAQSYPMHLQARYGLQDLWRGTVPEGTTAYSISVRTATGTQEFGPFNAPATPFRAVPWVGSAVGYQIFPERFWNGNTANDHFTVETDEYPYFDPALRGSPPFLTTQWNGAPTSQLCCHQYYGGDLQGIVARLDHLQSLGVTLIYLNPIFLSGSAHGYDTWDYSQVDPAFGDEAVVRALLAEAQARGMRVMWDFVPNHVGVANAQFQHAVRNGTASPYWNWFTFRVPAGQVQVGNAAHYDTFFGVGAMPKLNTRNPEVTAWLMDVVRRWTEFGFDGIRVDVPNEVSGGSEFFRTFRSTAKAIDPDVYLVAEIWQRSSGWVQGDQFDALMNYAIGQDVVERFVNGSTTGGAALQAMAQLYAEYPEASGAMQFNVISTHDTPRLLTKVGGGEFGATASAAARARHRLASAMLYALPGVPVTFQGDECAFLGSGGGGSGDANRYPMQWDACDAEMLAHYRQLGSVKHEVAALASPAIRFHRGEGTVLSFFRGEPGTGEVLAVFNAGTASRTVTLPAGSWSDVVSGQVVTGTVDVGAYGWRYLRRG